MNSLKSLTIVQIAESVVTHWVSSFKQETLFELQGDRLGLTWPEIVFANKRV